MKVDDIHYQEALRRYQVEVSNYERQVREYKERLHTLGKDDVRPSKPIPPIPPMKPIKLQVPAEQAPVLDGYNEGVEAAAEALEQVGEKELAAWVRKQKR